MYAARPQRTACGVVALGPTIFNMNVPLFDELDIGKALGERLPR
jgi:hypothetical protein